MKPLHEAKIDPRILAKVARIEALNSDPLAAYNTRTLKYSKMLDIDELAAEMRDLRASLGMSAAEFAADAGISASQVRALETGRTRPQIWVVMSLAKRYAAIRHYWSRMLIRHGERIRQAGIELREQA